MERSSLFYKPLLPFLTFVNCEDPYLEAGFLHNPFPCFSIVFAQLGVITRRRDKFVEIVAVSECYYLTVNSRTKKAAVPNMPSRKISWWRNVNKKGMNLFTTNSKHCQFEPDDWKNRIFFRKKKFNMNLYLNIWKLYLLRKSAAILNVIK